jgi:hypothetical protein
VALFPAAMNASGMEILASAASLLKSFFCIFGVQQKQDVPVRRSSIMACMAHKCLQYGWERGIGFEAHQRNLFMQRFDFLTVIVDFGGCYFAWLGLLTDFERSW